MSIPTTTTTTAPPGPPDPALAAHLLTPQDLPAGSAGDPPRGFAPTAPALITPDDLVLEPGACADAVAGYLASTEAGPTVGALATPDGAFQIHQRIDREPSAKARWAVLLKTFHDACPGTAVTAPGYEGKLTRRPHHLPRVGVELIPLGVHLSPVDGNDTTGLAGYVLFFRDGRVTHTVSLFITDAAGTVSDDDLYDMAISTGVEAALKLLATLR